MIIKNIVLGTVVTAGLIALPALGLAATYQYINTMGEVGSITANTPEEAMRASDISTHSGVMLVTSPSTEIPAEDEVVL